MEAKGEHTRGLTAAQFTGDVEFREKGPDVDRVARATTLDVALKPAMAFIVDIRHGNLDVHLMYKALFELSKDRAEFVSRLFSRKTKRMSKASWDPTACHLCRAISMPPHPGISSVLVKDTRTSMFHPVLCPSGVIWDLTSFVRYPCRTFV